MKLLELFNVIKVQNNQQPTDGASAIFEGTKSYSQHTLNDMVEDHLPENTRVWKIQWVMNEDGTDNYRPQFIFARTKDEAAHKFTERMRHPSLGLVAIESIKEISFDSLNEGEVISFPTKRKPDMTDQQKYDVAAELQRIDREFELHQTDDLKMNADPTQEELELVMISNFDIETIIDSVYPAFHWFASDFHTGENSNLYSVLNNIGYQPGPMKNKIEDEDEMIQELYYTLYDHFSNHITESGHHEDEDEFEEGKQLKNRKQPKDAAGAWDKAEKYTKYDPPKTKNKGVSARAGFVGG